MGNPKTTQFALCIDAAGCDDLEKGKIYLLVDDVASQDAPLRVIDESGEDYTYPASNFVLIDLPARARDALGG